MLQCRVVHLLIDRVDTNMCGLTENLAIQGCTILQSLQSYNKAGTMTHVTSQSTGITINCASTSDL